MPVDWRMETSKKVNIIFHFNCSVLNYWLFECIADVICFRYHTYKNDTIVNKTLKAYIRQIILRYRSSNLASFLFSKGRMRRSCWAITRRRNSSLLHHVFCPHPTVRLVLRLTRDLSRWLLTQTISPAGNRLFRPHPSGRLLQRRSLQSRLLQSRLLTQTTILPVGS